MKKIKILITAIGAPGNNTLIKKLKQIKERKIDIIGTDCDKYASGKYLGIDKFYHINKAKNKDLFLYDIFKILKKEKPDVLFCTSSAEILYISEYKNEIENKYNCKVLSSDYKGIKECSNKYILYKKCLENNIPVPKFKLVNNIKDIPNTLKYLGYPNKQVCFKPPISKGSRGFRILSEKNRYDLLINKKPNNKYITYKEMINIFKENGKIDNLLFMNKINGIEYDCMSLCNNGNTYLTTVKTREKSKMGIITRGTLIKNDILTKYCEKLIKLFNLSYNISIQFIDNYVIEINPRTSTYIYDKNLNEPYLAIKLILNEITYDDIKKIKIPYGKKMIRYYDQVFFEE